MIKQNEFFKVYPINYSDQDKEEQPSISPINQENIKREKILSSDKLNKDRTNQKKNQFNIDLGSERKAKNTNNQVIQISNSNPDILNEAIQQKQLQDYMDIENKTSNLQNNNTAFQVKQLQIKNNENISIKCLDQIIRENENYSSDEESKPNSNESIKDYEHSQNSSESSSNHSDHKRILHSIKNIKQKSEPLINFVQSVKNKLTTSPLKIKKMFGKQQQKVEQLKNTESNILKSQQKQIKSLNVLEYIGIKSQSQLKTDNSPRKSLPLLSTQYIKLHKEENIRPKVNYHENSILLESHENEEEEEDCQNNTNNKRLRNKNNIHASSNSSSSSSSKEEHDQLNDRNNNSPQELQIVQNQQNSLNQIQVQQQNQAISQNVQLQQIHENLSVQAVSQNSQVINVENLEQQPNNEDAQSIQMQQNENQENNGQENEQQQQQQLTRMQRVLLRHQQGQELEQKIILINKSLSSVQFFTKLAIFYKSLFIAFGIYLLFTQKCSGVTEIMYCFMFIDCFDFLYQTLMKKKCQVLKEDLAKNNDLIHKEIYSQIYSQSIKSDNSWVDIEEIIMSKNICLLIIVELYIIGYLLLFVTTIVFMFVYKKENNCLIPQQAYMYLHLIFGLYLALIFLYAIIVILVYPFIYIIQYLHKKMSIDSQKQKTENYINNLNTKPYEQQKTHINSGECIICLGEYTNESKVTILECGQGKNNHHYHSQCLLEWLKVHKTMQCPVCRKLFAIDN